jgi:hypothetical protein
LRLAESEGASEGRFRRGEFSPLAIGVNEAESPNGMNTLGSFVAREMEGLPET